MGIKMIPVDIESIPKEDQPKRVYPVPEQHGPLRRFEKEMRCASRGCSAPTYFKVQGIPYCTIHALRTMNEMLLQRGVEK